MEFNVFQFVPIAYCPVTQHHWEESGHALLKKKERYIPDPSEM